MNFIVCLLAKSWRVGQNAACVKCRRRDGNLTPFYAVFVSVRQGLLPAPDTCFAGGSRMTF
ncbi:hypothetical protein [Castellaniella sp.]|uniref:hypothetical protein n=1 Tax=Castellaniella sp. TaxID=1955812 RepID=UPI002AFF0C46|nr:hypothetical protein [Castellaniella sp.]